MGKITRPALCRTFAERITHLPAHLSVSTLEPIIDTLYLNSTVSALREVDKAVKSNNSMDSDQRRRIDRLRKLHEVMIRETDEGLTSDSTAHCRKLFEPESGLEYRVMIYHPERYQTPRSLMSSIGRVGTCIIDSRDLKGRTRESRREAMQEFQQPAKMMHLDALIGGSCYTFVQTRKAGKKWEDRVFTRLVIALDMQKSPLLFYDTVENGNKGTNDMQGWLREGKGYQLILSIASAFAVADRLQLDRLAVGERETKDFAHELGIQQRHIFGDKKKKIGYEPDQDSKKGPYCFTFTNDHKEAYIFNVPSVISPPSVEYFEARVEEVCDYVERRKRLRPEKKIDIATFFDFATAYIRRRKGDEPLLSRAAQVRKRYDLEQVTGV